MGRRILLTGLDTFWGGRVAAALEREPEVEMLLGMGTRTPSVPLERTEYVRADNSYSLLARIVRATQVDTIVHTFLVVDSSSMSGRALHEINVIGTMNLLAAAGAASSSVRQVVVKSSSLVYGAHPSDPAWFTEDTPRSRPPRSRLERSLTEVESYVRDFADENPDVTVTLLRFANVLGKQITTPISRNLARGVMPCIAGFDPLIQFVAEEDVVRCIETVVLETIGGTYNVAGDGKIPVSEVAKIAGVWRLPISPVFTRQAAVPLIRLGVLDLPGELESLLRYGRGIDTTRLKMAGFEFSTSSAGAVERYAEAMRLGRAIGNQIPAYQYDPDVEAFFKHSPAVVRQSDG
ncbi:MAG TPA: NAD-dependent epimerase/dehydratase family protein [Acidimicrobiales bacterium]|nr:NAD-dependent epimerase/dehydratase family protein [Acidimicrobiales bacterium]